MHSNLTIDTVQYCCMEVQHSDIDEDMVHVFLRIIHMAAIYIGLVMLQHYRPTLGPLIFRHLRNGPPDRILYRLLP
jgi:hypothetical protein